MPDTAPAPSADAVSLAEGSSIAWACLLRRHAHLQPGVPAIRFAGRSITYAQLDARVEGAARALAALGVGAGDRVAVLMGNRPEYMEVVGGATRLGAITVPVNFRLVAGEIAFLLRDSGARVLVVDPERAGEAAKALADLPAPVACLQVAPLQHSDSGAGSEAGSGAATDSDAEVTAWEAAVDAAPPRPQPGAATLEQWRAEAPTLIMYTSGTTGRPKGAVLSHLNLFMQTVTHMRTSGVGTPGSVGLVVSPLFHIAGIAAIIPSLVLGSTTVLAGSGAFDAGATLDLMEDEGVTSAFLVPTQWQALCDRPDVTLRRLRLQSISWGASPALPSTLQAMDSAFGGVPNVAVFGQTEMSPVTCSLDGVDAIRKSGSVGRPVPTVDVRVVDADMADVVPGDIGEIVYRGPSMMSGYWHNPSGTADAMQGGWFHSGDLVRVDDEGFVTVVDRKKDMIISGGENIYSSEVEAAIDGHAKVREVAVVAGPHARWVETPVAFVVPVDPDDPPTPAEIVERSVARLASYKKPTRVEVVAALPRNASGKVLKNELRRQLREERD